ncbi:Aspartate/methionine/tyrosine aminotransferase [Caldanaerobius fijiensis DSM 17918]|uniref:Aminotransferase n=1 Tax=Caldanaerobius fijiensis DSM 17918 TaxID=1121256 RepID=A0A1M5CV80_9THEO|nr:pyridoxal phosphate-dependent aminotransferase [Caldanaerobius fijiensis]SHF58681.1 Aspartate/methionine/tyrosine aminotransferase [Caldanaerobius fijiensis DSM 17918]
MLMAERLSRLGTENAFEVLAEVNKLVAAGRHIISFALGEPDFDTPENIKQAGIRAILENKTHYGPSAGIPELREAVAAYISRTRGIDVSPDEVVITPGAKPIIFYTIHALVNPGEEVIYPNPGFPIYESVINFVGAKPVPLPLLEERNFSVDVDYLRSLITDKTKLIILNSPQNPTGGMLSKQDLEAIAEIAIENDIWVLSDEVYSRIVYDGEFYSIASIPGMKERTILLDGFSKTYAMTGWRLGYGVVNAQLAQQIARLETNCESCTATFIQYAGVEALNGPQDAVDRMVREFKERRDLIVEGLNNIKGIRCFKPHGSFYVFPNVTEACRNLGLKDSKALQQYLLYNGNVAVLPRTSFGVKNVGEKEEYLRLSYATSKENIIEGLKRIKETIEG